MFTSTLFCVHTLAAALPQLLVLLTVFLTCFAAGDFEGFGWLLAAAKEDFDFGTPFALEVFGSFFFDIVVSRPFCDVAEGAVHDLFLGFGLKTKVVPRDPGLSGIILSASFAASFSLTLLDFSPSFSLSIFWPWSGVLSWFVGGSFKGRAPGFSSGLFWIFSSGLSLSGMQFFPVSSVSVFVSLIPPWSPNSSSVTASVGWLSCHVIVATKPKRTKINWQVKPYIHVRTCAGVRHAQSTPCDVLLFLVSSGRRLLLTCRCFKDVATQIKRTKQIKAKHHVWQPNLTWLWLWQLLVALRRVLFWSLHLLFRS